MSVLFALTDAVKMTDECGISDPLLGTLDIIRDLGQTRTIPKARFVKVSMMHVVESLCA